VLEESTVPTLNIKMEKITASIVVYKNEHSLLTRAIESFLQSSMTGPLTVVDNSPTDELRQLCDYADVTYIFSNKNLGYGRAHNLAIKQYINHTRYHLVLNPDVSFDHDVIEKLFYFMESNPQAGLAMPKVLAPEGKVQMLCKLLPTPLDLTTRRFFPAAWFKNQNEKYEMKDSGYNHVMNVPFLSGCFMFLRAEAIKKVGLFDERYFLYAEDTDLSRRIHQQFETLFYPETEIRHVHARGSYKDVRLTFHNIKSAVQYFNKWGWFFDEERDLINEKAITQSGRSVVHESTLDEVMSA
jgi:GT2 family glycosyltransferase